MATRLLIKAEVVCSLEEHRYFQLIGRVYGNSLEKKVFFSGMFDNSWLAKWFKETITFF